MSTNLILHERINTTVAKAKELRPWIERLIHKAKQENYQGSKFLQQTLFSQEAVQKLEYEIAPRFKKLPAGYTKITRVGNRKGDAAPMATIEIIGNPMIEFEENEMAIEIEQKEMQSFWDWEATLLKQEVKYFEQLLWELKRSMDRQVARRNGAAVKVKITADLKGDTVKRILDDTTVKGGKKTSRLEKIKAEVEEEFATKKKFLLEAYDRAKHEEKMHLARKNSSKYKRYFLEYGFPQDHKL